MKANNVLPPFRTMPVPYVIASDAEQSDIKVATGRRDGGGCSEYQRGIPTEVASARERLAMARETDAGNYTQCARR